MMKPLLLIGLFTLPLLGMGLANVTEEEPDRSAVHGLPGQTPGTESWLVTFKSRSFDLQEFRQANYNGGTPAQVAAIVADLEDKVVEDQAPFARFVEELGGKVRVQWWLINGCAIDIPFARLDQVRRHPRVLLLEPDQSWEVTAPIKVATNANNHVVDSLQAKSLLGKGVAVAIMDSGVDSDVAGGGRPHMTFYVNGDVNNKTGGGIGGSRLLANVQLGTYPADDPHGHGTGVASIAAGEIWSTTGADRGHAPLAGIVGYAIAAGSTGSSNSTVMTTAWQRIAADAVKYGTVAANNSFSGSYSPTNTTQQALDACALNANVVCVVSGGNNGKLSGTAQTQASQACVNGLAVGAFSATTKKIASFSSEGPMYGDTQRTYPDIAACGVSTVMAKRDAETSNYVGSGTSMASPMVAGAATLFRSINTTATALETKAALLVTTEDIYQQNPTSGPNGYGMGWLRDDRLVDLAQGGGALLSSTITKAGGPKKHLIDVQAGKAYAVVVTWFRHTTTSTQWSDLGLKAGLGTKVYASSDSPRNLYEKVVFLSPLTGKIEIEVSANSLEKDPLTYALAAYQVPAPFMPGQVIAFGAGCPGSGKKDAMVVVPQAYATQWGESRTSVVCGYKIHRCQQIITASQVPTTFTATGIAFRHDNASYRSANGYWAQMDIKLGYSKNTPQTMSTTFAANIEGTLTTAYTGKVNMPYWTAVNTNPGNWLIKIPFTKPWTYTAKSGSNLLVDTTKSAASTTSTVYYYIDAVSGASSVISRVYTRDGLTTGASGSKTSGMGAVIGFTTAGGTGAIPILAHVGKPEIGTTLGLELSKAAPSTAGLLLIGLSDSSWAGLPLPFGLGHLGATGCSLQVGANLTLTLTTDGTGAGKLNLPIPNQKALIQSYLYLQTALIDPQANPSGTSWTGSLSLRVGGQP